MNKHDWPEAYGRLKPFFEDAARTYYEEAKLEKGFKFWAVSEVLTDTDFSDNQIKEPLQLDRRGDLGVDGFFEDADTNTLILVQSKFHEQPVAVGNQELSTFLGCLNKVLNPTVVVAAANPLVQDAHRAARDAIAKGWTLRMVFVTSGYLSPEGRLFARENETTTEYVDGVAIRQELDVYDLERLSELYQSHLSPARFNTDIVLRIP